MEKKKRIIFTANGFMGHVNPILRIAQYLQKLDTYQIIFVTSIQVLERIQKIIPNIKIYTVDDHSYEYFHSPHHTINTSSYLLVSKWWVDPFQKIVQQFQPDLIVTDYILVSVCDIAKKRNIQLIINFSIRLSNLWMFKIPNFTDTLQFGGLTIYAHSFLSEKRQRQFTGFKQIGQHFQNNIVLVDGFYGFDETITLPPNFVITGPFINEEIIKQQLSQDLIRWIKSMKDQNLDIIYVSFGSLLELSQEFIHKLYNDLKKSGKAVIWALRLGKLPQNNHKFYVKNWLPQIEILKLPEIKISISHCGWGAVTQCIYCQKPILAIPGFSDQITNSETIQEKKIGLLHQIQSRMKIKILKKVDWDSNEFIAKINDLIENPIYKSNIKKMKNLMLEAGGLPIVHKTIKNCLENGSDHLIDKSIKKIRENGLKEAFQLILKVGLGVAIFLNRDRIKKIF